MDWHHLEIEIQLEGIIAWSINNNPNQWQAKFNN
jgi:hypothetical protein